ncbi:MAG: peptide chain release factor N(5)-glutamine methyltransferase [Tannerella sp.]|jgi:release factor glutamine methyltransferase|nr:peptide chain release factor N(5)-glutamine methyltransferase [Tannerella sp.]
MKQSATYIQEKLNALYLPGEIRSFIRLILSNVCGLSYNQQILCKDKQISVNEKREICQIVDRLGKMEPLQYILGETEFCSLPLKVNPSVLIPRPETEELTDMIIKSPFVRSYSKQSPLRILDIGTGSGCIAIALAKYIPHAAITATDISDMALQTAKDNARLNDTDIRFIQADILNTAKAAELISGNFDIIVSNPPYIKEEERIAMDANVLDYEPHLALFVPNNTPLLFYNAITDFALQKLTPEGMIYFEINAQCDVITNDMLHKKGFTQTDVICDLSGKKRFISIKN